MPSQRRSIGDDQLEEESRAQPHMRQQRQGPRRPHHPARGTHAAALSPWARGTPRQGGREGNPAVRVSKREPLPNPTARAARQAGGPRAGTSAASDLHCIGGHAGFGGGLRRRVGHPMSSAPACLPAVPSEPSPSKWLVFGWTYCHGSVTAARLRILPVTAACVRSGFQAQSRRAPAYVASSFLVVSLPGLSSHLFPRQR
jgi:hypothetical protein